MTDDTEWGPWIEHDGKGCQVPVGIICETQHQDGSSDIGPSCGHNNSGWSWYVVVTLGRPQWKVIRYRVRKPRALKQLRDMVENLPAPVRETEDAQ